MVQRNQWDIYWGPKKINFLIRDIDDTTRAAASVESCRFVVPRSLGGCLGSVVDMGKCLRRVHWCFHRWIHMRTGAQLPRGLHHDPPKISIQSSRGAPRIGTGALGDYPTPDLSGRESASRSASEKSVQYWTRWRPVPVKNVNFSRAPGIVIAVSSDPILPQR